MIGRVIPGNRGETDRHKHKTKSMKLTSILTIIVSSLALVTSGLAADKKYKEGGCCDKATKKGEKCAHPCCVTAEKEGKVCAKCNK